MVIEGGSGKSLVDGDDAGMTNASPGLDSGESGLVDETVILNTPEGIWRTITSTDSSVHGRVPVA